MIFEILQILFAILFFAVIHSVFASHKLKENLTEKLGDKIAFYRFFYTGIAGITFLFVLIIIPKNSTVIYDLQTPYDLIFYGIQVLGMIGILWTAKSFDWKEFIGIKQIYRFAKGNYNISDLDEHPDFRVTGAFKYHRHPAYFYSIIFLGFRPFMDLTYIVLFIGMTAYFIIGSRFEEKKLIIIYGDVYRKYQKTVPKFIPYKLFGSKEV